MDISRACDILDINKNYSLEELRKKYRMYALKFHPDRNKSTDA
jgi:DnaJ-class molecular chaperone